MQKDTSTSTTFKFGWTDIPRSIYYFLDKDRRRWLTLNIVVLLVLFWDVIPPLVLGRIVDFFASYNSGQSLKIFYSLCIFLGVTHSLVAYIRLYSKNLLSKIAIGARTRARIFGFERLINLPLQWHAQENTGNKIERIFSGSQSILDWTRMSVNGIFPIVITFVGILIALAIINLRFALFTLLYLGVFFTIEYIFNRKISKLSQQINASRQRASGTYIEGSGNILAIKALGAERGLHSQVRQTEEAAEKLLLERNATGTKKWYWFQTLNGVAFLFFAVMVGLGVADGLISIGMILVFFTYFDKLRSAAYDATDLTSRMIEIKADLGSMMPIFHESGYVPTGHEPFPKDGHNIHINDGSFSYPSGQVALSAFNFQIQQGEIVGVAGPSGGGKSTLVKILLGLYSLDQGSFTIGRQSYYDIEHEDLIAHMAAVLQETELFNMSLQENITLLREVDKAKLAQAITISQLDNVIKQLPDGLQTMVGERGYKLSGGERQRLGIARAIYKDAPVMILDEATSSLDSQTEKNILDVLLKEFAHNKTILIIAHRISTLQSADRVVFIDQGRAVEEGTYRELIANPSSELAHLYAMQSGGHRDSS